MYIKWVGLGYVHIFYVRRHRWLETFKLLIASSFLLSRHYQYTAIFIALLIFACISTAIITTFRIASAINIFIMAKQIFLIDYSIIINLLFCLVLFLNDWFIGAWKNFCEGPFFYCSTALIKEATWNTETIDVDNFCGVLIFPFNSLTQFEYYWRLCWFKEKGLSHLFFSNS